ncbi:unnamed protein product [Fraxinus pennsylvanica]|uniref:Metallo-beta-lactamase domain-containing protein n=1 Tax=Fraxinus pennsylvanica TaxID=56036 RepID=A0AAD2DSD4_9LAMI|nr:unnamed protein product [Fraxinus pennsylvanica]
MGTHRVNLAVIIKNPSNDEEFLLIKQTPPPKLNDPEYDSYQDSDLWDLPLTLLTPLDSPLSQHISVGAEDSSLLENFGLLNQFDLKLALDQEYPPGVKLIPMGSRTAKPFHTTNLVVFFPGTSYDGYDGDSFVTCGDVLIVDPGCKSTLHKELEQIIAALPQKLIVFVTHHHHDHVDGLSIVQKCKPDAVLLAHESTMRRIQKDDWSLDYVPVLGSEEICIGGQRLRIISAPGHTDGHMSLLHVSTHSLIVGDHCVGQGSALLDITSGGNMSDYFRTTYKFMDLSPHVLIPMHGRVNMWPKHMLCGYLKNRRNRESTILKSIKGGGKTLFDIVAYTYADVDRSLWLPAASNVRLHVDHLAQQDKLPKDFSLENFNSSLAEFAGNVAKIALDLKLHSALPCIGIFPTKVSVDLQATFPVPMGLGIFM